MEQPIFFDTWASVGRVVLVGLLAYAALLIFLRVSGKRTLSKMNAFDLVVTVALGSTLATVLLNRSVPLVDGVVALGLLVGLQYVITWISVRSPAFQNVIKAEPTVVMSKGKPNTGALMRQRVTMEEVRAAARQAGHGELDATISVVLETDGSLSVLKAG